MSLYIKSISDFAKMANYPSPKHPFLGLVKIEDITGELAFLPSSLMFGFYTIGLKIGLKGYLKYGRKHYDFQEGVLVFTAPNQVLSFENLIWEESRGWYLFFEKSLLANTPFEEIFERYSFFGYNNKEALHLSKEEEIHLHSIFTSLHQEYDKPIDHFSKQLIVSHLQMILMYSERYYKRQFITRNDVDSSFLARFEEELHRACSTQQLPSKGIPTVKYLADRMNVSPNYMSDALRNITGMGAQKHIHYFLIDLAKTQLLSPNQSISEVAYNLGFESHTYFSRFFKKMEGITPKEFLAQN